VEAVRLIPRSFGDWRGAAAEVGRLTGYGYAPDATAATAPGGAAPLLPYVYESLARAHARSGEPAKISGYLGKSDKFDQAIADFSIAYADQSERDHEVFMKAVRAGKLEVFIETE
jgi:hypothetical protein